MGVERKDGRKPRRLDKVVMLGLEPVEIEVLRPGFGATTAGYAAPSPSNPVSKVSSSSRRLFDACINQPPAMFPPYVDDCIESC